MGSPAAEEAAVSPGAATRAVVAEHGEEEARRESTELNPM
jgi:hypothetical protein